jgi:NitT/TauT family transport system permease protein
MMQERISRLMPPLVVGIALALLYMLCRELLEPHRRFLMPSPVELWTDAFGRSDVRRELGARLLITASIAFYGLAASIAIGVATGIVMFRSRWMERAVAPYLVVLQSVPILAITPLLQTGFGYGMTPKVLIAFIISFFSIPTTLLFGLKSVDKRYLDLFRLQGAGWWTTLWKLGMPSAMPALFAGLRIAAGLAVIGAITGELFFQTGEGGLGQMLINAKMNFDYAQMYAALITASALSVAVFLLFTWLGNRLFAVWHESSQ